MKSKRQEMILKLIEENILITQEDLQESLKNAGYDVTQSTVSRDIRALKLVKARDAAGNYRYVRQGGSDDEQENTQYIHMLTAALKDVNYSLNNVVLHCRTGMASSACVALDILFKDMMIGSIAGDDTVIVVTKGEEASKKFVDCVKKLL